MLKTISCYFGGTLSQDNIRLRASDFKNVGEKNNSELEIGFLLCFWCFTSPQILLEFHTIYKSRCGIFIIQLTCLSL